MCIRDRPLAFPDDDQASTAALFKSTLGREGATYKALHTVKLAG